MTPMLKQRHPVHRPHEDRDEHHPMIERRAEQEGREQAHGERADGELNEFLHPLKIGPKEG